MNKKNDKRKNIWEKKILGKSSLFIIILLRCKTHYHLTSGMYVRTKESLNVSYFIPQHIFL